MIQRTFLAFCFFLTIAALPVLAQEQAAQHHSFHFRGEPLARALETIARQTGMDIVYDPKIVEGLHVYQRIHNQAGPAILKKVLKNNPLDFITLSSGTIVIIQAVKEAPSYGSYYGKVVDQTSGEPLSGASVMLADASGGTNAGPSGTFALNSLQSGTYKIIFSYIGYEPIYKTIHIRPDTTLREQVRLQPKPVSFSPVVITGHRPRLTRSRDGIVEADTDWETTGRMRDPIRSLSLVPGIQNGLPLTDLHLQGGQPGDHRIRLDGVPVYNPYSFGRMFSAFSPFAIGRVQLQKAGYDVTEGSQTAGFINLEHDLDAIGRSGGLVQADPLSLNMRGDLFITGKEADKPPRLKVLAAARTNYWDWYRQPTLERTLREWDDLDPLVTRQILDDGNDPARYRPAEHHSDVQFHDLHLAARYALGEYSSLETSFYTGKNAVQTDLLRQAPPDPETPRYLYGRDAYRWNNIMGQVRLKTALTSRLDFQTQLSYSANRLDHRYLIGTSDHARLPDIGLGEEAAFDALNSAASRNELPTQRNQNQISHLAYRTGGVYYHSPRLYFEVGAALDVIHSRVQLSDLFYLPTSSQQQSTLISQYLNSNWMLGPYWVLTAGNRLTYDRGGDQLYSEPRISLQYDYSGDNSGSAGWSLKLGGGLYRQFINQYSITNPGPTALVPSLTIWSHASAPRKPKSWNVGGSVLYQPEENQSLHLDLYYKWQPTMYTASYPGLINGTELDRSSFNAFAEPASMRSLGASLRWEQTLSDPSLELLLGYDYSYNRVEYATRFGRPVPPPWNEPHRFQLRMLWRATGSLTAVAKWRAVAGRSWGFRQSYYNFLAVAAPQEYGGYTFGTPGDDRLPVFHQLDLSLIYRPAIASVDAEFRLDLINVLDRRNTIDWSLASEDGGNSYHKVKRYMPGFSPSVSLQFKF